jgi:hypothetical protein
MGLTVHFEVLNQLGTPMMYSSSLATRPNPGIQGRIFFRTDSPYGIYRDNGTTWDIIAAASAGITGSGTATEIAYFDSASSIASTSNLFWDNTNARLGVNTNTPTASFDVHGTAQNLIHANNTALGNSFQSFQLQGLGKWQIGNVYNAGANYFRIQDQLNSVERLTIQNTGEFDIFGFQQTANTLTGITGATPSALPNSSISNTFTFNSGITTAASVNTIGLLVDNNLNYSGANTINVTSYNACALIRNGLTFGSAAASVTYTQGTGIKALVNDQVQYIQNGANSGTISHYANIQILGDQKTGAGLTTFTNRYGLLINDYNEFTAGNTYTNRWGIYQAGLNESNFFAGKVGIGSGYTPSLYQLDIIGGSRIIGGLEEIAGEEISLRLQSSASKNIYLSLKNTNASGKDYTLRSLTDGTFEIFNYTNLASVYKYNFTTNLSTFRLNSTISDGNNFYLGLNTVSGLWLNNSVAVGNYAICQSGGSTFINSVAGGSVGFRISNADKMTLTTNGRLLIGTLTENTSALLNVTSTTQGILFPRMTTTQKNAIGTPAAGLVVFDTTLVKLCVYNGTAWETITSI